MTYPGSGLQVVVLGALLSFWPGPGGAQTVLDEGFESGVVPPVSWGLEVLNQDYTWSITSSAARSGVYSAEVAPDPSPFRPQNEWLLTPELLMSEATLTLWSQGNTYWCRDVLDNCDLYVWLIVDELGGADDIWIGEVDPDWEGTGIWSRSIFDLTPHLPDPAVTVRVAFNYLGWDSRRSIRLDDVQIDAVAAGDPIFSDGFESGDTSAWSATIQ